MIELAEAHGLALASIEVTRKVESLLDDVALRGRLRQIRKEAEETRDRCLLLATPEMLDWATTIHERARDMAHAWFKAGTDPRSAWSFLAMIEAGEVTTWGAVAELAPSDAIAELATWALPIHYEHLAIALRVAS